MEPTPGRDIQAIMEASNYVRPGIFTAFGGSRATCICPKTPCGGVAAGGEVDQRPEHDETPTGYLHWAAECPGSRRRA